MAEPSRLRRQLGAELLRLREQAELSQRDMSAHGVVSQAKVSRVERGAALPKRSEVARWMDLTHADPATRDRVVALTEAAHSETRPWSDMLDGAAHLQNVARERDVAARLVRNCQLTMVPGLLQTAEYARQLIPLADPTANIDHAAALAARVERQQVLYREDCRFEFLLGEQALWWAPAPGVMAAQLDRLMSMATLVNVELAVLPSRREGALSWHNFIYREPANGDPPYVTTELLHGAQVITDSDAVAMYATLWQRLWESATAGTALLARVAAESRARTSGCRSDTVV